MKTLSCLFLFLSFTAFAKEVKDFNKVLIQNVQKDIRNNNVHAFEKKNAGRGPASVDETGTNIKEDPKFEKTKQIGPNKW